MKTLKLAILAAVAFAGALQVQAQQTNLVQNLSIQLFGFSQGGVSNFRGTVTTNVNIVQVGTRQIIQALGTSTGNTFSPFSRLVMVTPVDGSASPSVQVRDGSNTTVDVTGFFVIQSLSDSVDSGVFTTRTQRGTSVSYKITRFALQDNDGQSINLHFDVDGIATINSSTPFNGAPLSPSIDANVSGSGDRNGNLLILQGSVDIIGHTFEVQGFNTGTS